MRRVRFFEQRTGRGSDDRVLLIGIMDSEGDPAVDGGRREAVRRATRGDTERYAQAYDEYYRTYAQAPQQQAPQQAAQQPASEEAGWRAA